MSRTDRYRPVDVCMYASADFNALSAPPPNAQSLFTRLLTCGHDRSIPGLLVIGLGGLADELQWSIADTQSKFEEITARGMGVADWPSRVVWMPAAIGHRPPANRNVVKGWGRYWREIPECALKVEAWRSTCAWLGEHKPDLLEAFVVACPKPRDVEQHDHEQLALATETGDEIRPTAGAAMVSGEIPEQGGVSRPHETAAPAVGVTSATEAATPPAESATSGEIPFAEPFADQRKRKRKHPSTDPEAEVYVGAERGAGPSSPAFTSDRIEPPADFAFIVAEWKARGIGDAHYDASTEMLIEAVVLMNLERRQRSWIRTFLDRMKATPECDGWSLKRAFSNPVEIDRIWRGDFHPPGRGPPPSPRARTRGRKSAAAETAERGARLRAQLAANGSEPRIQHTEEAAPAGGKVIDLSTRDWSEAREEADVGQA